VKKNLVCLKKKNRGPEKNIHPKAHEQRPKFVNVLFQRACIYDAPSAADAMRKRQKPERKENENILEWNDRCFQEALEQARIELRAKEQQLQEAVAAKPRVPIFSEKAAAASKPANVQSGLTDSVQHAHASCCEG
jgi:hypothetical protein